MVALVLLGTFLGTGYESVIAGLRATHAADGREGLRQQVSTALELWTREAGVASAVDVADDQEFQFDADVDGDGDLEPDISYRVQNGALQRTYNGATITLVNGVTGVDFEYTNRKGKAVKTPVKKKWNEIRIVGVTITASRGDETHSMASAVYLRNNR